MNEVRACEFLPAALELQRTPPLPAARWIGWAIMGFFALAVLWSWFGRVDVVALGHGRIVPTGRVKQVQSAVSAVVTDIAVQEGDRVRRGDVLLSLDATRAHAELARLRSEERYLRDDRQRLKILLQRLDSAGQSPSQAALPLTVEQRLEQQFAAFNAERRALDNDRRSFRAEQDTLRARIARLEAVLPLLSERVAALDALRRRAMGTRSAWLELEQQRIELARERAVLSAALAVEQVREAGANDRLTALAARTATNWRAELADATARLAGTTQEIRKAAAHLADHQLRAAATGTVQQLAVHTVGGFVRASDTLMTLVPDTRALHIEAWIANKDIGFVAVGQPAVVKIETFPFTRYGTLAGAVTTLSHDAVADEQRGLVYLAQVSMARTEMITGEASVPLVAGMAVTVEFNLGRRRVLEFLLAPLLRYGDEGLTER